ncbi:6-bladed beta-propeller [Chitinophaga deserti]|uniref:6-bladed beta-propeller n=1 Tax=Chitinophaga deserti TaxID=2164099 RepID=UPI001300AA42|nr:6-bladed beta-propeller [Chitinophaga deserti]
MHPFLKITIPVMLALPFFSCQTSGTKEAATIQIKPVYNVPLQKMMLEMPRWKLSGFIDTISYIVLKPTEASGDFGEISKIYYTSNRIVLHDRQLARAVFLFDYEGTLQGKISETDIPGGSGAVTDISVDPETEQIGIYSAVNKKVFFFSNEGNLLREVPIHGYFATFEITGSKGMLFYREIQKSVPKDPYDMQRLCFFNTDGKYLKGWFKGARNTSIQVPTERPYLRVDPISREVLLESPDYRSLLRFRPETMVLETYADVQLGKTDVEKRINGAKSYDEYLSLTRKLPRMSGVPLMLPGFLFGQYTTADNIICGYSYQFSDSVSTSFYDIENDIDSIPLKNSPANGTNGQQLFLSLDNMIAFKDEVLPESARKAKIGNAAPFHTIIARLHLKKKQKV